MSLFTTIKKRYAQITAKQFIFTGLFMLALAGTIGAGFASKGHSNAAVYTGRDSNVANSIMNVGNVGCLTKTECYNDIKNNNPSDLQGIYSHFGLQYSEYDRFLNEAKEGIVYMDGTVRVNGEVVMNGTWSIGRKAKDYSWQLPISGVGTYHASKSTDVQGSDLPVYVMFDSKGVPEFVVMKACGNPVGGNKPGAECKDLTKYPVADKKNTYKFNSEASTDQFGLAKIVKFDYYYNTGSGDVWFDDTSSAGEMTKEITFTKAATVTVKVTVDMPGVGHVVIVSNNCKEKVGVVKEEFLHVCEALLKTQIDTKTFRFNVVAKHSNNVKVVSADFTLDGTVTAKGVTTDEDKNGNIDRTYTFTDNKAHSVSAVINFLADGKVVQSKESCVATTDKTPECKPGIPEGDDLCKDYCKPDIPVGDIRCQELPKTGAGSVAGLFAGISAAGAVAHRLFVNRRRG